MSRRHIQRQQLLHPFLCLPTPALLLKIKIMLIFLSNNCPVACLMTSNKNIRWATLKARTSTLVQGPRGFRHLCRGTRGTWEGDCPMSTQFPAKRKMKTSTSRYEATARSSICSFVLTWGAGKREGIREKKQNEATVPSVSLQRPTAPYMTKKMLFTDASGHLASQGLGRTQTQHTGPLGSDSRTHSRFPPTTVK